MGDWNRKFVAVLGIPFDNVTMREAVEIIDRKIEERGFHQVATANVDFVVNAIRDPSLQELLGSCDLIVADGMPIVWASRIMGAKLKERVSGVDLVPHLAKLAAQRSYGIFLLGASETSSRRAAEGLQARFENLRIVGRYSPPVASLEQMDHESILARIEEAQPDILLVAMGHPKQERWLAMHRDRLNVPLCMGVGASLDFLAGEAQRAPLWMQTAGLEWLHRAIREPRRLAQRYMADACGLARHLPAQLAANAIQPRRAQAHSVGMQRRGNVSVVSVTGDVNGPSLLALEGHIDRAFAGELHMVLDLQNATYLGPDCLGLLVRLSKQMKACHRELWLANAPSHVVRSLRTSRMSKYFLRASGVHDAIYRIRRSEIQAAPETILAGVFSHSAQDMQIRVELLKDFCRRIIFFSQTAKLSSATLPVLQPTAHADDLP